MGRSVRLKREKITEVEAALNACGMSQEKFAEELKISRTTLHKFLSGSQVDRPNFKLISDRLGFKMREIMYL